MTQGPLDVSEVETKGGMVQSVIFQKITTVLYNDL